MFRATFPTLIPMKPTNNLILAALCASLPLFLAAPAQASLIVIQPVATAQSTQNGGFNRLAVYTIDGSGLSDPTLVQTGSPAPVAWPTHNNGASGEAWMNSPGQLPPLAAQWIIFDLGEVQPVRGMHVWNYNEVNLAPGRSLQDIEVSFATSLGVLNPSDPNWSAPTPVTLAAAPGLNTYQGVTYALPDADAR